MPSHLCCAVEEVQPAVDMGEEDLAKNGYPRERFLASIDEHLDDHLGIGRTLADRFAALAEGRAALRRAG